MRTRVRGYAVRVRVPVVLALVWALCSGALAQSRNLAPGFTRLAAGDKVVIMPVDVELFSLSAGGVAEPRADWTVSAQKHLDAALRKRMAGIKLDAAAMDEKGADEFAEQVSLHAAVAQAVALHHGLAGNWALPTKAGKLDWTFEDAMRPLRAKTGARYGLFLWVRDSYASAERKVAMVALALLGIGVGGGAQVGYASLVDLETGRLVWFNRLARGSGDLREEATADETAEALLSEFPSVP